MKRALSLGLALLAIAVSATDLAPTRPSPSEKAQWAPSGNSSALHTRAVFLSETRSGAGSYAREHRETAAEKSVWSYANLNPLRYVDPDGRRGCFPGEEHTTCEARLIATGGIEGSAFRPSVPTTFVHPLEAQSQRAMAKVEQTKRHMFVAAGVGLTLAGGAGIALLAAEGGLSFGGFMALSMSTEAASGRHQADRNGPGRR